MLKWRVLTAAVLIPPFVAALYYLNSHGVALLLGIFVVAAAWEWTALAAMQSPTVRILYTASLLAFGGAGVVAVFTQPVLAELILGLAVLWWLWSLVELMIAVDAPRGIYGSCFGRYAGGVFILAPVWIAVVYLHHMDPLRPAALLFVFVLVWVADSVAYFIGRAFGKTKLAPRISPGKSVEGVLGGLCATLLLAYFCGAWIWELDPGMRLWWTALIGIASLFSVLGDLVESKFKRLAGVKDSGTLLPGHGGVLDRIDALTAAAPVYGMGWYVLTRLTA